MPDPLLPGRDKGETTLLHLRQCIKYEKIVMPDFVCNHDLIMHNARANLLGFFCCSESYKELILQRLLLFLETYMSLCANGG